MIRSKYWLWRSSLALALVWSLLLAACSLPSSDGGYDPDGIPVNAAPACSHFLSQGWTQPQAAGIVGNLWEESGINPSEGNPKAKKGGGGIAQWEGARWNNPRFPKKSDQPGLLQFAASNGKEWKDFDLQLQFIDFELSTSHKAAAKSLKATKNPTAAASAFMRDFEQPSEPHEKTRQKDARRVCK